MEYKIKGSTLSGIANAIRGKTGSEDTMLPSEMPAAINTLALPGADYNDGYNEGYDKGKAEGIDYDVFWDTFQQNGEMRTYEYVFAYNRFDDTTYNPKYPIICAGTSTQGRYMFHNNTKITNTKVPIDVSGVPDIQYAFGLYLSKEDSKLETIPELIVSETVAFGSTFVLASALKDITITGKIGKSINLKWSPLTPKSIQSVYDALSTSVTGQTCTFKRTAVNAAFTTEEWETMKNAKSNWTFALA